MNTILTDSIKPGEVYSGDENYSAAWFSASVDRVALYIEKHCGIRFPFIHLFASNSIKTIIVYFAIIKAGKIVVLLSPELGRVEREHVSTTTPPAATFQFTKNGMDLDLESELTIHLTTEYDIAEDELADVCTMVYTAAVDGYAKAAMLTHENLLSCAETIGNGSKFGQKTICCSALPFDHLFGLQTGILAPFLAGGKTLIADISTKDGIISTLKNIGMRKITHLYSVPILLFLFSKFAELVHQWSTDIVVTSGSCKLDKSIRKRFLDNYGICLYEGYGLTEASPVCTWQFPGEKVLDDSVGKVVECCNIGILDEGNTIGSTGMGEIVINGENVMKGYYKQKCFTRKSFVDSWFRTGDLGRIDNDGFVFLTGLKKKMLNVNGKKVYPAEIERFLRDQFQIQVTIDGKETVSGSMINAYVKCKSRDPILQEMSDWCRANLSREKRPRMFFPSEE